MTPDQVKAARALLGWSMSRLGMRSGTSVHTVRSFEQTGRVASMYGRTDQVDAVAAIRATLVQPAGRTAPIWAYLMRQGASLSWST